MVARYTDKPTAVVDHGVRVHVIEAGEYSRSITVDRDDAIDISISIFSIILALFFVGIVGIIVVRPVPIASIVVVFVMDIQNVHLHVIMIVCLLLQRDHLGNICVQIFVNIVLLP